MIKFDFFIKVKLKRSNIVALILKFIKFLYIKFDQEKTNFVVREK